MAFSGWRIVGDDVYTCVPPPGYEIDPAVLAAIHEFDPGLIPIWRIQFWIRPNEERREVVVHSGIARHFPHPRYMRRAFHVLMPAAAEHPVPNFLDAIFEDQLCGTYMMGGPGGYMQWDWSVYYWCREKFMSVTVKRFDQLMENKRNRLAELRKKHKEELAYRLKQIEPYLQKRAAGISDVEWDNYLALMRHREALRQKGIQPGPINDKTKMTLDLGSGRSPRPLGKTYGRVAPAQELNK